VNIDKNWLSDWVEVKESLTYEQLAADLVKVGLEEEAIHTSGVTGSIVLGKVVKKQAFQASNGKTINYCRTDCGSEFNDKVDDPEKELEVGSRGIICGAQNFDEGDLVAVVLPGARLPGDFEIAARKTYGHISNGMQCSEKELGLGEDSGGIIVLQKSKWAEQVKSMALGTDLKELFGLNKEVLEINITPDRGYCFSLRGVAREFALSTGVPFKDLVLEYQAKAQELGAADSVDVELQDERPIRGVPGCARFATIRVEGVNLDANTPAWMKHRLEVAGFRSISLPVDVTNYVMMHFGQPLHAYDLDEVVAPIVVRRATPGEKIETLDEKQRELFEEDLLITDSKGGHGARAIGVAGVMGGANTEVTSKTTNILLESAYFEPVTIARSARRHKLPSEASKRFERGIDPKMQESAALFAAELLVELGGAKIQSQNASQEFIHLAEVESESTSVREILLSFHEVKRLLGVDVPKDEIENILLNIGCKFKERDAETATVLAPSWRPDLTIPADLVEEVARIWGYDRIPSELPKPSFVESKSLNKSEDMLRRQKIASDMLASRGFVEVLTYPFSSTGDIKISNPLAGDKPYLRRSVLETLIDAASLNMRRQNVNIKLFEVGKVFLKRGGPEVEVPAIEGGALPDKKTLGMIARALPDQPTHLAAVISDEERDDNWKYALAEVENTLRAYGISKDATLSFTSDRSHEHFHPTRCASVNINSEQVGVAGELNPRVVEKLQLNKRSSAFEIDLDKLNKFKEQKPFDAKLVSTFPSASEDYAFVVDQTVEAGALKSIIAHTVTRVEKDLLESVELFDEYIHKRFGEDKKSLTFAVKLRGNRTLKNDEIQKVRAEIIGAVEKLGGKLRL
jgi:phenylalanyl-tRNA synthetase beta chain